MSRVSEDAADGSAIGVQARAKQASLRDEAPGGAQRGRVGRLAGRIDGSVLEAQHGEEGVEGSGEQPDLDELACGTELVKSARAHRFLPDGLGLEGWAKTSR